MGGEVREVDGMQLINGIKLRLQESLSKKIKSVEDLVKVAERASALHTPKRSIETSYYNSKKLNKSLEMKPIERLHNIQVNLHHSTVHVPTNVYDESVDILNGVEWSRGLDEAFKRNFNSDLTCTWQYFCSAAGFFRSYPGIEWNTALSSRSDSFDTFDCRVRDWYLQAAAFPKDLVILLDCSGSMRGLRNQIGKATVEKVLDTLNDDDFFNIIQYSDELQYIRPCFNGTLIQATDKNKIVAKTALQDAQTQGIAQLGKALVEGFEILKKFKAGRSTQGVGSACNQAIMVVSDGANDMFKDIFEQYNFEDKNVRVFTFLIGREVSDSTNIKWMACNNKGRFSHITSLADVHEHVQEYIHVMSRPMVIGRAVHSSWTNVYSDSHEPGLGMMTTISKPVYDTKEESLTSGILLGVMGTDVPLVEITKVMPNYLLGVNAFSFAVTSNGYALFHPKLKPRQPNLSDYGGAFNAVDLSDLEPLDPGNQLRHRMIQKETGSMKMTSFITHDQGRRGRHRQSTYFFTDIQNTPFSIGISIPEEYGKMRLHGSIRVTKMLDFSALRGEDCLIAPWAYCKGLTSDANLGPLGMLVKILEENKNRPMKIKELCDVDLLESLMFDAEATRGAPSAWTKENWDADDKNGVEVVFIGTKAGLTRFKRFSDLTDFHFLATNYSTIEELYYQRAVENKENVFTFSVPFNQRRENLKDCVVTASSGLFIHDEKKSAPAAVVGYQMKFESFYKLFLKSTEDLGECHSDNIRCFLMDENAYVVLSTNPHDVGSFFGMVPGMKEMMLQLIISDEEDLEENSGKNDGELGDTEDDEKITNVEGVFEKLKNIDSQAICHLYQQTASCAPGFKTLNYLLRQTRSFINFLLKILIVLWVAAAEGLAELQFLPTYFEYDQPNNETKLSVQCEENDNFCNDMLALEDDMPVSETPCTHLHTFYLANHHFLPLHNSFRSCGGQSSCSYSLSHVPGTNLMLLVMEVSCVCDSDQVLNNKPLETNSGDGCGLLQVNQERKGPSQCYSYDARENSTMCGQSDKPNTSAKLLLLLLLIFFV